MNIKEFKQVYENAKKVQVINNDWFNYQVWFWASLTSKQLNKMYKLMLVQGAKEKINNRNEFYIELNSGLMIKSK